MDDNRLLIEAFTELAPRYEVVVDNELQKFWGWSYEGFVRKLIEITPIFENDIVLDVATGTAIIPRRIVDKTNKLSQIVGLDITFDMLKNGQEFIRKEKKLSKIKLTCANAMIMPFNQDVFDVIFCGLAPHHMDVTKLLREMRRVLKVGGVITIADVGGSPLWRIPGVKAILRIAAFLYFLTTENFLRAWAEAAALSNVRTADEWYTLFDEIGFINIQITKLSKSRAWIPSPLLIKAMLQKKDI